METRLLVGVEDCAVVSLAIRWNVDGIIPDKGEQGSMLLRIDNCTYS